MFMFLNTPTLPTQLPCSNNHDHCPGLSLEQNMEECPGGAAGNTTDGIAGHQNRSSSNNAGQVNRLSNGIRRDWSFMGQVVKDGSQVAGHEPAELSALMGEYF